MGCLERVKGSHTVALSSPLMGVKFGRAARYVRTLVPVIRLLVLVHGSGHFSLLASFAFSIVSTLQLGSSMISITAVWSVG